MNNYLVTIYNSDMRHEDVAIIANNPSEAAEEFCRLVNVSRPLHGTILVVGQGIDRYAFKFEVVILDK